MGEKQRNEGHSLCFMFTSAVGYAYFTDWRLGGIVRVRKTDGGERMVIRRGISHIMHVKSFNADLQTGEWPVIHSLYQLLIWLFLVISFSPQC